MSRKKVRDLTGERFGKYVAISPLPYTDCRKARWVCKCDCGRVVNVLRCNLTTNKTKSCGKCYSQIDLTGKVFGTLTVMRQVESKYRSGVRWECKCSCEDNKIIEVQASDLLSKRQKSCGCSRGLKSQQAKYKEIRGAYWNSLIYGAKSRNLDFSITQEYAWDIFVNQNRKCPLSGLILYFGKFKSKEQTASLDRIDSSKGYIEGNVQWVHKDINWMKKNKKDEDFITMCRHVANTADVLSLDNLLSNL